jgi:peptidoglycan/xylan/chitin deacetylase (PgdA/CDA1 family)
MTRWDWTWEDRSQANRSPTLDSDAAVGDQADSPTTSDAGVPDATSPDRASVIRRRRAGGALTAIAILALLVALLSNGGTGKPRAHPRHHLLVHTLSVAERAAATARAEQNAINSVLAYTPAVTSGGSKGNELALTFDDGPGPYTQQLVGTLDKLHVQATFFAIGEQEQYFSEGTIAELKSGDVVGDHTETHPMMAGLSAHEQYEELFEQMARIELLGGPRPRLFRPPYGSFDAATFHELHHLHLLMVLWSVDTSDYTLPGVSAIVQSALAGAKPGAIILMHDGGGNRSETIAALPAIVAGLRKRGLHPVTVPRLLMDDPPPHGLPLPTNLSGD